MILLQIFANEYVNEKQDITSKNDLYIKNLEYRYLQPVFMILNNRFEFPTNTQSQI